MEQNQVQIPSAQHQSLSPFIRPQHSLPEQQKINPLVTEQESGEEEQAEQSRPSRMNRLKLISMETDKSTHSKEADIKTHKIAKIGEPSEEMNIQGGGFGM